jgi:RNA polymerase sigma factor (sigma-70 family)
MPGGFCYDGRRLTRPPLSSRVNVHDVGHDSDVEMRDTQINLSALVVAALAGDRWSRDDLVSSHLPFVYTIVRRALGGHPDTDDVVQDVMLRALRELRELRTPDNFRAWLATIAVRQVSTHLRQQHRAILLTAPLDTVIGAPDAAAEVEDLAVLQLELSGQRAEVVRASRWLDADDWALLSLWWLEVAGRLTRTELAEASGISVAHAGVRVQRMRAQLDVSRSVVAALETQPQCRRLDSVTADWDGLPGPMWRKRIGRHIRSCSECTRATAGRVPAERLLAGYALLPVPVALAGMVIGKIPFAAAATTAVTSGTAASTGTGAFTHLAQAVVAHPVAAVCVAATLIAGAAASVVSWPPSTPVTAPAPVRGQPVVGSLPTPSPTPALAPGPVSLEAANEAGMFASTTNTFGMLVPVGSTTDSQARQRATFEVVAGLADPDCFSFRLQDGRYLRHSMWRLRVFANDGTALFRGDATFCVRPGSVSGSVELESSNYPGWFLRRRGNTLWVDHSDGTASFRSDCAFRVMAPLSR